MKQHPPSTPFSTPLSGSARQAEARIRNLFQCEKKRPPLPLLFLAALLILSCGWLVSCRSQPADPPGGDGGPALRHQQQLPGDPPLWSCRTARKPTRG